MATTLDHRTLTHQDRDVLWTILLPAMGKPAVRARATESTGRGQ